MGIVALHPSYAAGYVRHETGFFGREVQVYAEGHDVAWQATCLCQGAELRSATWVLMFTGQEACSWMASQLPLIFL